MSEEKTKAEALSRARRIQPGESPSVKEDQKHLEETCQAIEALFTSRGYGGYIRTDHINTLRETQEEIVKSIETKRDTDGRTERVTKN